MLRAAQRLCDSGVQFSREFLHGNRNRLCSCLTKNPAWLLHYRTPAAPLSNLLNIHGGEIDRAIMGDCGPAPLKVPLWHPSLL